MKSIAMRLSLVILILLTVLAGSPLLGQLNRGTGKPGLGDFPLSPCYATTTHGDVIGVLDGGSCGFLKIPYAASPLGDRRWKRPNPATPWTGPLDGTQLGPPCPQYQNRGALPSGPIIGNEDCLSLNVWRPEPPTTNAAPVMVFFHPGRFILQSGTSSADAHTNGKILAANYGVVVVTINSRLGPLGYLAHKELTADDGVSGNYGFMDQQAALRWVGRNIANFGGDTTNVTLFGEATGTNSITEHIVSLEHEGLFRSVILQSGTAQREPGNLLPEVAATDSE